MAGLEMLWNGASRDFQSKNDAAIATVHWLLLQNGYRCLGLGENVSVLDTFWFH